MRKPAFCICKNKGADQVPSNCIADQRLCARYMDSTIPYFLNPKLQASSHLLWLYTPVCDGPGRKPRRQVFMHADHLLVKHIPNLQTACGDSL